MAGVCRHIIFCCGLYLVADPRLAAGHHFYVKYTGCVPVIITGSIVITLAGAQVLPYFVELPVAAGVCQFIPPQQSNTYSYSYHWFGCCIYWYPIFCSGSTHKPGNVIGQWQSTQHVVVRYSKQPK